MANSMQNYRQPFRRAHMSSVLCPSFRDGVVCPMMVIRPRRSIQQPFHEKYRLTDSSNQLRLSLTDNFGPVAPRPRTPTAFGERRRADGA